MNETEKLVIKWAEDRGLIHGSSPEKQFIKLIEEVGELSVALQGHDVDGMFDAIGDMAVVLTILCDQISIKYLTHGTISLSNALFNAYSVIKDRQGKIVNGTFVKEV